MNVKFTVADKSNQHSKPFHTIFFCIDEEEGDQRMKKASKKQRPNDSSSTEPSTSTSLPTAPTFGKR